MKIIRLLYNLAFPFVLVALLPGFLLRMVRRGKYRHKFGQRFGLYSPRVAKKLSAGGWTWVHAVSVGEVLVALKLIREMKAQDAGLRVVLSTTTSTGFAMANVEKSDWLEPIYNPLDFWWTVRQAIRLIRPKLLILVEAEVWPNLTAEVKALGSRLALVNARLSARSEGRYRLVRPLIAPLFNQLDLVAVQETRDVARWAALGVDSKKILCTGSIKFDEAAASQSPRDLRADLEALGVPSGAPVLLAASTHAGEEAALGEIFLRLRQDFPTLFLLVVPRHAERGRQVRADLEKLGLSVALREGGTSPGENPDALVANTTGELRDWYRCAQAVFIGKSLTASGGQNPAEAIAEGKPVAFGPHMENFRTLAAQLVRENGAKQAADAAELEQILRAFLADPAEAAAVAARGAQCLASHHGATARTVAALAAL